MPHTKRVSRSTNTHLYKPSMPQSNSMKRQPAYPKVIIHRLGSHPPVPLRRSSFKSLSLLGLMALLFLGWTHAETSIWSEAEVNPSKGRGDTDELHRKSYFQL